MCKTDCLVQSSNIRSAALEALQKLPMDLYASKDHVLGIAALLNLVSDDDESLRTAAAEIAARFVAAAITSQPKEVDALSALRRELPMLSFSPTQLTDLIHERMNSNAAESDAWSQYLLRGLLPSPTEAKEQLEMAYPPVFRLYRQERPNLFRDRTIELKRTLASALAIGARVDPLESSVAALLQQMDLALASADAPLSPPVQPEVDLLGLRLLASAKLLRADPRLPAELKMKLVTHAEKVKAQIGGDMEVEPEPKKRLHRIA